MRVCPRTRKGLTQKSLGPKESLPFIGPLHSLHLFWQLEKVRLYFLKHVVLSYIDLLERFRLSLDWFSFASRIFDSPTSL